MVASCNLDVPLSPDGIVQSSPLSRFPCKLEVRAKGQIRFRVNIFSISIHLS